jgi:hypothetical protein
MNKLLFIIAACLCLAVNSAAQDATRIFDNFDTSRGVNVIKPPAPPVAKTVRKKINGKWQVVTTDPLVKKTVQTGRFSRLPTGWQLVKATRLVPQPNSR